MILHYSNEVTMHIELTITDIQPNGFCTHITLRVDALAITSTSLFLTVIPRKITHFTLFGYTGMDRQVNRYKHYLTQKHEMGIMSIR